MFKKTFFVSTAALLLCFLASCSLFNSPDNSGSVKLTLSRSAARNADSGSETLYVDVSLKGDYSQTQTIPLPPDATEATAIFDQIKLNATVYIEANVYKKDSASDEKIYTYTGKSDTIKIKSGENNISLTLKKLYSVSFNLNGGTGDFKTQRVVSGETATEPETEPTKEATEDCAYEFAGWYTSDDVKFDFDKPIKKDTILYAKWNEKHIFTVTFDSNNGDNEPFATERIVEGKSVSEPENHPEKEGTDGFAYVFSGWYKSIDDETPFDFNTPIEESITLYAKWITKQWFTVTFKADIDADEDFDTARVLEGNKVSAPETNPTKAETAEKIYTFDCWVTADDEAFDFDTPITGNITLYARYTEKNIYTITFDSDNGATSAFATEKVIEGYKVSAPTENPTKDGTGDEEYEFAGWFTSDDEGKTLSESPFDFNTPITGNLILYAGWAPIPYFTVTFNVNGGKGEYEAQRVLKGKTITRPSANPTKEADEDHKYYFVNWYISTDGGKTFASEPFDFSQPINSDTELYAVWTTKDVYTITFDLNGGDGTNFEENVIVDEKLAAPSVVPERKSDEDFDYTFAGWFTSEDEGKTLASTPFNFDEAITDNITLYAGWTKTAFYKVSFNLNGGKESIVPQRIKNGSKANEPEIIPTKDPAESTTYEFAGWYTSTDDGTTLSSTPFDFNTPISESIVLYAKWEAQVTSYIDVDIPYENATKEMLITSMRGLEDGTWECTAKEGYDSYTWKWDGVTQTEYNNRNVFITPIAVKGGTYTVTLLVTKIVDGETKYYSETTQVSREQ